MLTGRMLLALLGCVAASALLSTSPLAAAKSGRARQPAVGTTCSWGWTKMSGGSFAAAHGQEHKEVEASSQQLDDDDEVPLIPRKILFGNPKFASPILSPDGRYLAYLAPSPDLEVLNVFVRATYDADTARQVTNDTSRGIRSVTWAEDSRTLLYLQDSEGDENFHLWAIDATATAAKARDLTPGDNVKASTVVTNKRFPDEILVGTNQRDASRFDMYRCVLETGHLRMVAKNPGDVVGWGSEDESFEVRMAQVRNQEDSSSTVRIRDGDDGDDGVDNDEWRDLVTFPYGEEGGFVDFCPDGSTGYITSTLGRDTKALLQVNLTTGETIREVFSNDKCDVRGITLDQDTKQVRAVASNYARTERIFFDPELEKDYEVLDSLKPDDEAEVSVASRTRDEKLWVVAFTRSDGPTEYVLYNQVEKTTTPLFVSKPDLLQYKLQPMEDVRIPARDGLELVGYHTRAVATVWHEPTKPFPLILLVHGGPWARDFWGFNAQAQWFANRGTSRRSQ